MWCVGVTLFFRVYFIAPCGKCSWCSGRHFCRYAFSSGLLPCSFHSRCGRACFRLRLCTHRYRPTEEQSLNVSRYDCTLDSWGTQTIQIKKHPLGALSALWKDPTLSNVYQKLSKIFLYIHTQIKCALCLDMSSSFPQYCCDCVSQINRIPREEKNRVGKNRGRLRFDLNCSNSSMNKIIV